MATQTMLDDAFFDVENFIVSDLTQEFAEQEEIAFTNGDGDKSRKGCWPMAVTSRTTRSALGASCSTCWPASQTRSLPMKS